MADFWWIAIGSGALIHGVNALEHARAGRHFRPWPVMVAILAGSLAWEHGHWLLEAEAMLRLSGGALYFAAVAPLLGYLCYGHGGAILRFLLRALGCAGLTVILTVLLWQQEFSLPTALGLSVLAALVPFLPWSRWRRWRRRRGEQRRVRQQQRLALRAQLQEQRRHRQEQSDLEAFRRMSRHTARELERQQQRINALERGEHAERERRDALRAEVRKQVRLIRQAEVAHLRDQAVGLRFHEHYGFLMAESWRALRADLESGARVPALESDAFFFQVVDDLLEASDFEERYLHEEGRQAIRAVNSYLAGSCPLSRVRAKLEELRLQPGMLAPVPLEGELVPALLEAWLLPHRRFQDHGLDLFEQGEHPQQEALEDCFEQMRVDVPSRVEWRALWDERPALLDDLLRAEDG